MTALRRRLAGVLARWAVRIDPDPALSFTSGLVRRVEEDYIDLNLDRWRMAPQPIRRSG